MKKRYKRVRATLECLIMKDCTAVEIARHVGCINPYNYIYYARHEFGIPIVKEKDSGVTLHKYRILRNGIDKAMKIIKGDVTAPPLKKINKQAKHINKSIEANYD